MAKRSRPKDPPRHAPQLSGAVEAVAQPPPMPAAAFASLETDWIDEEESEGEALGMPGAEPAELPAELPDEQPQPPESDELLEAVTPGITCRAVSDEDVDRLWDWCRQDPAGVTAVLGITPRTSLVLHAHFLQLARVAAQGRAATFAIDAGETHIGFVLLDPLIPAENRAVIHLYLSPAAQGSAPTLFPALLRVADAKYPQLTLIVMTPDQALMRLCQRCGFALTYLLSRPPGG